MSDTFHETWYVARRVRLPIETAAVALDALVGPHDVAGDAARALSLRPIASRPDALVVRQLEGSLSLSGIGPAVPVEIELSAWSRAESELGIRPTRLRPPRLRAERYFTAALGALAGLHERVTAPEAFARASASELLRRAS